MNVPTLDARDRARVQKVYKAEELDFALRRGAAAIDRGIALATFTTGFVGAGPDFGALERGHAAPHYGARP